MPAYFMRGFHEKARCCQLLFRFGPLPTWLGRPTGGAVVLRLTSKDVCFCLEPPGFHSHSFSETAWASVPVGVLGIKWVLLTLGRTFERLCQPPVPPRTRSHPDSGVGVSKHQTTFIPFSVFERFAISFPTGWLTHIVEPRARSPWVHWQAAASPVHDHAAACFGLLFLSGS